MESRRYYYDYDENERDWSDSRYDSRYVYDTEGNVAHDFSLFEGREVRYVAKGKKQEPAKKKSGITAGVIGFLGRVENLLQAGNSTERSRLFASFLAVGIMFAVGIGILLSCYMEHHEVLQQISSANASLSQLQQEYVDLTVAYESKMSNAAIEEYATETLGMQKRADSQTEHVTLGGGDVFELTESGGIFQWLEDQLDELLSYMD